MNFRSFVLGSFAFGLASLPSFAQDLSFSGSLSSQAGIGLPNTHDNRGDFLLGQTTFDGTVKSYIDEASIVVNAQLVHDALGAQSANGYSALVSDDGSFALKLKEAYIDWKGEMLALRVGRQVVSWGKADDIQITDIICPKDESNFVAGDYNESRLGIDAVRLSLLTEKMQFDAFFIPFFTPSILPLAKGNPLKAIMLPDRVDGITINTPQSYRDLEHPNKHISNSEYAFRASAYTSIADVSFYYFYGWDDIPFFKYSANIDEDSDFESITVSGKYNRMMMVGLDAAIPIGDLTGRRAEAGQSPLSIFAISSLSTATSLTEKTSTPSHFKHRKTLLNETLTLMASGSLDMRAFSAATELEADYKLTDAITLSAIGDFYYAGPTGQKGLYGDYHNLSSITFKGKMNF